jgi:thiazole synthase
LCNCYAVGIPIGSGQGLNNLRNIQIIIENANVPSLTRELEHLEATNAMELGADGVLLNTAVAQSRNPAQMASAMKLGVQAGWFI